MVTHTRASRKASRDRFARQDLQFASSEAGVVAMLSVVVTGSPEYLVFT